MLSVTDTLAHGFDLQGGNPDRDWRTVLSAFDLNALERLQKAFDEGRVITRRYSDGSGRGCLLHFLSDGAVGTKSGLMDYSFGPNPEVLEAARRIIRFWDGGMLTSAHAQKVLAEAIAARREANSLESEAIDRAGRFGWLRRHYAGSSR